MPLDELIFHSMKALHCSVSQDHESVKSIGYSRVIYYCVIIELLSCKRLIFKGQDRDNKYMHDGISYLVSLFFLLGWPLRTCLFLLLEKTVNGGVSEAGRAGLGWAVWKRNFLIIWPNPFLSVVDWLTNYRYTSCLNVFFIFVFAFVSSSELCPAELQQYINRLPVSPSEPITVADATVVIPDTQMEVDTTEQINQEES